MTYDGYIAAAPGALVVLDRDLNVKSYVTFPGEAVDNSIAIDERNSIYVVTSRRMLKVIRNGQQLWQRGDLPWLGHDAYLDGFWRR